MPPQCKSILIVEDDSLARENLAYLLNLLGYGVCEADDGITALKMLGGKSVDAVITDCDMPRMNGINLLQAIRANENLRLLPVILMTQQSTQESKTKAIRAGADALLEKPLSLEILDETLGTLFNDHEVEVTEYLIRELPSCPSYRSQRDGTFFHRIVRYCMAGVRSMVCAYPRHS